MRTLQAAGWIATAALAARGVSGTVNAASSLRWLRHAPRSQSASGARFVLVVPLLREQALIGETIEEKRLREICESLRKLEAIEDIHAPASYRQQLATVLPRRALLKAHERIAAGAR